MSALERFIVAFEPKNEGKVSFRILLDEVVNEIKAKADANSEPILMRDYFAAIASEQDIDKYQWNTTVGYGTVSKIEVCSREEAKYKYADAMMQARGK